MSRLLLILFIASTLYGCGMVKRGTYSIPDSKPKVEEAGSDEEVLALVIPDTLNYVEPTFVQENKPPAVREVQSFLELAYKDWQGIPYSWGGDGYEGIDCSAFMQIVYEDYFSLFIPRTTLEQLRLGSQVRRRSATAGDMVFFKTGRRTYHVGIMIDKDKFLHASASQGVKVSSLQQSYWRDKYLTMRRVLES